MRPFGAWRDNWHMAQLADMLARVNGNRHIPISHYFYMDPEAAAELRKQEDLKKFMTIVKYVEMKGG